MQLSTSTSAPDSNLLPLPSAPVGSPVTGDASPGAFADFLPVPVPAAAAEVSLNSAAPALPIIIPGGIAFTLAAPIPAEVPADFVAPTSTQTPADISVEPLACACDSRSPSAELSPSDEAPAFSEPFQPLSTLTRPVRSLPSAAPALRSARALPRAEAAPTENLAFSPAPAPLPAEVVIALPLDLNTPTPALDEPSDALVADEMPARAPAARNQWIMPPAPQAGAVVAGNPTAIPARAPTPALAPARDLSSTQEIATFADVGVVSPLPADTEATDRPRHATSIFPAEPITPESSAIPASRAITGDLSKELAPEILSKIAVTQPAENRPAPRAAARAEKFAAARTEILTAPVSVTSSPNKNFLTTEGEEVTHEYPSLGITVAKSSATMTAASTLHPSAATPAAVLDVNVVNAPAVHSASIPSAAAPTPAEITAAAHKAVDAVLASTERLASATQSSVNLKFSVGGADLDVRVEVRAGAVHATFRTDSPELRTALAQEWQSTNSQPADHTLRLAPPVFASGDRSSAGAGTGFSGEPSSQQARDQNARPTADFSLPGSARGRFGSASSAGTSGVSALPARSAPATTLHLHAFA